MHQREWAEQVLCSFWIESYKNEKNSKVLNLNRISNAIETLKIIAMVWDLFFCSWRLNIFCVFSSLCDGRNASSPSIILGPSMDGGESASESNENGYKRNGNFTVNGISYHIRRWNLRPVPLFYILNILDLIEILNSRFFSGGLKSTRE